MENPFQTGYYCSEELRSFGFAHVGDDVQIAKNCTIVRPENIRLGDHARIDGFTTVVATGPLEIGARVHIHIGCVIGSRGSITLHDFAVISHHCRLLSASDCYDGEWMIGSTVPTECVSPKIAPIVLEKHAAIGCGSSILPGVTIHEGAALLAHSVANRDLAAWTMNAGVPAQFKRNRKRGPLALERAMAGIALAA